MLENQPLRKDMPVFGTESALNTPPALEMRDVFFRYERNSPDVLRGLSLTVRTGEIFCLLGGNGSGKSTALACAAKLLRPYAGTISVFGKKLKNYAGQSLYQNCLALLPQDVQTLIQNAAALGRPVSVAGRTQLLSNGTDDDLTAYYAIGGRAPVISDKFDEVSRGEVFQLLMGCRESDWPAILKGTSGAKIAAWWDRAVDIIPISGGKGAGIRKVLAYYGLTPEDAMAFGDGNNDIEMFQAVGHSVAMGNASADLKAIASEVCRPCAEDGIYHYCKENGLI